MPHNIFNLIKSLQQLSNDKSLTPSQKKFIDYLLTDDTFGLTQLTETQNTASCGQVIAAINQHLASLPLGMLRYKQTLKNIAAEIKVIGSDVHTTRGKLLDDIYQRTQDEFHGTIVLPIIQGLDYRLGSSRGECSGYIADWIYSLLNKQPPFGVDYHTNTTVSPIKFETPLGARHPELNHCVPLTENVSRLQTLMYKNVVRGMQDGDRGAIHAASCAHLVLRSNTTSIVKKLLALHAEQPHSAYYLSLRGVYGGHALGFFKDENAMLHFVDPNSGWYRFKTDAEFSKWLNFYFNAMDYPKKYVGCELLEFSLTKRVRATLPSMRNKIGYFFALESRLIKDEFKSSFWFLKR